MKFENLDVVTKRQICAEYMDKNIKTAAIMAKYGLNSNRLRKILEEANIPRRVPKNSGPRSKQEIKKRVCPCCHKLIDNPEARFCWNCGTDVRAPEQIMAEQLDKIMGDVSKFYPANARDDAMKVLIEIKKYLKDAINT